MIKRTLCFSNPASLSLQNGQLVIRILDTSRYDAVAKSKYEPTATVPVEDIGVAILDHPQITISHGVLSALLENNVAVIVCNKQHMPIGLQLPLDCNTLQSERFHDQIEASMPLRKQLWQQTVSQKIRNQAAVLKKYRGAEVRNMLAWADGVKSGDGDNVEGRAAAYYWGQMFCDRQGWTRARDGEWPNALLNYGYAILRAVVARSLVASGLLPTLGIHHHNRYNAYCLADDIMEPYRPYVDALVLEILPRWPEEESITTEMKRELLSIPVREVVISGQRSPLMIATSQTTASLYKCYAGELRKVVYPEISLS